MENFAKDSDDLKESKTAIRNLAGIQKMKLEKLMKNPDKPVIIPDRQREKKLPHVPDFVRNVMGSSAGAGSGEFHVYRHLRRKEYARQKIIHEKSEKNVLDEDYQKKLEEHKKAAEDKTAKKRAKRLKKKQQLKRKKIDCSNKTNKKNESSQNSESSDEDEKSDDEKISVGENKADGEDKDNREDEEKSTSPHQNNSGDEEKLNSPHQNSSEDEEANVITSKQ